MYKHAITALALTASGLLLAAGPAAAADEIGSGFTSSAACPAKVSVACLDSVTTVRPSATSSTSCSAAVTMACPSSTITVRPVNVSTTWAANTTTTVHPV
ncbi:hypothetical protein, partial [Nonomuraea sp. NPDC049158]|uniref:hypothetical protein n=1 Tax=Nonomuraea sp. NPDC049158 TaxID=3155649 RepID=UPI0033F12005